MSTKKKVIQINPELFKLSGGKTKKNREKKEILSLNPIVSPNNLKNKLLKRIKDHKTNELKKNIITSNSNSDSGSQYSDEFYGAINYLSDLSKKQKQQQILNNKTLKNQSNIYDKSVIPTINSYNISLDLPPELSENYNPKLQSNEVFNVNYKTEDGIPYGCLKNGKKKTYREWKELTKIEEIPNLVRPPTPPKQNTNILLQGATPIVKPISKPIVVSREERLEQIKNKLKKIQDEENALKMKNLEELNKIEKDMKQKNSNQNILPDLTDFEEKKTSMPDIEEMIKNREEKIENDNPKQYLKKTIKRKFILGKSDKLRKVGVLIKDKQTRKNIINTQKELKKTNITDVRKYLRQYGIIKVGSTCPADILRKTFESAMLTGEVVNTNKETLLHNFLHP
jgi:hypothetical protein